VKWYHSINCKGVKLQCHLYITLIIITACQKNNKYKNFKKKAKSLPHTDEDISTTEDEEENVLLGNIMKVSALLVSKEKVRFPETFEHLGINSK